MQPWTLTLGDSLAGMATLPEASVDAVVTSPPYADQRLYGGRLPPGARKGDNHRSRKQRREAPARAVEWLTPFLAEMLRVVKPTGSAAVNVGVILRDLREVPWVDWLSEAAEDLGWQLMHRIVWYKPNGIPPSDARFLNVSHEYVLWLAKDARSAYRGYDADTRTPHSETSLRRIGEPYMTRKDERYSKRGRGHNLHPDGARPLTVFTCGVGAHGGLLHPAPMAPQLALHLVSLTTPPGGLVLDPFAGSATTGLAALERRRRFIGWENNPGYHAEGERRLAFGRFPRRPPPAQPEAQETLALEGLA